MSVNFGHIIVGWDGSPAAGRAVQWAARAAGHLNTPLEIITVLEHHDDGGMTPPADGAIQEEVVHLAAARADHLAAELRRDHPGLPVRVTATEGDPARQLRNVSSAGDLVVLGRTGTEHRGRRHPLGAVAADLIQDGPADVAVVPDREWDAAAPVVIGIMDPAEGNLLGEAACAFARAGSGQILALSAWEVDALTSFNIPFTPTMMTDYHHVQERVLEHALAPVADRHPDIALRRLTVHGNPRHSLIGATTTASLLVLGHAQRHRPWPHPQEMGRSIVPAARCPVLLIRHPDTVAKCA